jgi:ATP-binding cassette subfamily C (CFTR/MRP) protein 4
MRSTAMAFLYEKVLKLSKQSMAKVSVGQITTIVSSDVERFVYAAPYFPFLLVAPLHAGVSTWLMWDIIGAWSLCGLALVLLSLPIHMIASKFTARLRTKTAQQTDKRVKIMSEVLAGMRVIKMYAWEKAFSRVIDAIRAKEISFVKKNNYIKGSTLSFFFCASALTTFVTFVPYQLAGNTLSAYKVFTVLAYFNAIRLNMVRHSCFSFFDLTLSRRSSFRQQSTAMSSCMSR